MRIAVCIKQVPAMSALEFDSQTRSLRREGVRTEVSAFDVRALLKAVALRAAHGGEVVAVTMGPPQAREALAECLALGADRALHLCDRAFAGADTLATARALAAALRREAFDLVLCGRNSVDAETGQVGPELAELLDWPQVTVARTLSVDLAARTLRAERETDEGLDTVEAPLPAVVTAAEDLAPERFTTKAEREAALRKPIATLAAADLGLPPDQIGAAGSPTWVLGLEAVEEHRRRELIEAPSPQAAVDALVERLLAHGLFGEWSVEHAARPSAAPVRVNRAGARDVLVVAEISFPADASVANARDEADAREERDAREEKDAPGETDAQEERDAREETDAHPKVPSPLAGEGTLYGRVPMGWGWIRSISLRRSQPSPTSAR